MGCSDKVLFIHPKQVTQLRKNPDFLSADKYTPGVSLTGEIGMIAAAALCQQEGPADRRRLRLPHRQAGGRPRGRWRDPGADHLPQARGQH